MLKRVLMNVAVSLVVSTIVLVIGFVSMRQHVRDEVDRSIKEREEQFVSRYRENTLKLRRDFGLPDKPVTTVEDVFEPLISLTR